MKKIAAMIHEMNQGHHKLVRVPTFPKEAGFSTAGGDQHFKGAARKSTNSSYHKETHPKRHYAGQTNFLIFKAMEERHRQMATPWTTSPTQPSWQPSRAEGNARRRRPVD